MQAILVDVNGTLFDTNAASLQLFEDLNIRKELIPVSEYLHITFFCSRQSLAQPLSLSLFLSFFLSQLWFAEVLRDAFAAQLAGVFAPFHDWASHHLLRRIPVSSDGTTSATSTTTAEAVTAKITNAWEHAEPYPDVAVGLSQIAKAGLKVAVLTNGSRSIADAVLETADCHHNVTVFDVSEALAFKPDVNAYKFACNALSLPPAEVMMVAAHAWDVHGALQAGMKAAYVQRDPKEPYPSFLDQPQLIVEDFVQLAEKLLV